MGKDPISFCRVWNSQFMWLFWPWFLFGHLEQASFFRLCLNWKTPRLEEIVENWSFFYDIGFVRKCKLCDHGEHPEWLVAGGCICSPNHMLRPDLLASGGLFVSDLRALQPPPSLSPQKGLNAQKSVLVIIIQYVGAICTAPRELFGGISQGCWSILLWFSRREKSVCSALPRACLDLVWTCV